MDAPVGNIKLVRMKVICALSMLVLSAPAAPESPSWSLLQNADFQIYSQAGDTPSVRASLLWFEQLRSFFAQAGLPVNTGERVRVIGFRSEKDYNAYRLRPTADAYYVGTESRDYIVMPSLEPGKFGIAAHEYAHVVLHAAGMHLPAWLNEGLAEFFSTVRISNHGCELGGDIRVHSHILRDNAWMPLSHLLELKLASIESRQESNVFYAQSWALTDMLLISPEYHARFPELIASLTSGQTSAAALTSVYGKSLEAILSDLHSPLLAAALRPIRAPGLTVGAIKAVSSELSPFAAHAMLAELLLASGELDRAEALYTDLAREAPENSDISAALGTIALRKGNPSRARLQWKLAMEQGITDASLCYNYALLAEDARLPTAEIGTALQRAIALKPSFDDARFKLALLESAAGNYEAALKHLKTMQAVAPQRAFAYWVATAFAQDQLGQHADSKRSAQQALHFATSNQERAQAIELAYVADTDLTVQFTRDANGAPQIATTRVPRGAQSWNPFVEPQDNIRRAEGQLRSVECGANNQITGMIIDTAHGILNLAIPDPLHVLIRGATEFTCGPQPGKPVTVEYAATSPNAQPAGILRGMEIR